MTIVVALDGPAGSGKSTVARLLADRLGWPYLDTGSMYRAATLQVLRAGVDPCDAAAVLAALAMTDIDLDAEVHVLLDGIRPGKEIRTVGIDHAVSDVAGIPEVRSRMAVLQRAARPEAGGLVAEGRDMTSVIFPDAEFRFFLTAPPGVRAQRRHEDGSRAPDDRPLDEVRKEMDRRDAA
ncbi:MAG: (d)CMP kinase, partial [Planctomycetota bacterium]|nr:(d)CMP kinase [Planctomycetota bacterium]